MEVDKNDVDKNYKILIDSLGAYIETLVEYLNKMGSESRLERARVENHIGEYATMLEDLHALDGVPSKYTAMLEDLHHLNNELSDLHTTYSDLERFEYECDNRERKRLEKENHWSTR